MCSNTIRNSILAPYIDGLLDEKHANGYKYASQELILNRFDQYCCEHDLHTIEIDKAFLDEWMEHSDNEVNSSYNCRVSCVRQLLLFMSGCGIKVYIPQNFCSSEKVMPHIFEPEEIKDFFAVVDSNQPENCSADRKRLANEYRLLFRWYCCCGLRNNEAAGITSENVNLKEGILTIMDSKGNKDRLVYLSEDLRQSSEEYYHWLVKSLGHESVWFFPSINVDKPLPNTSVDAVFKRFWKKTRFSECSNQPTVHDFRFSFVVRRMNHWAEEGVELQAMMPYLSRYLGHKKIEYTFYYYYLVEDAYKTIAQKDTYSSEVIPEVKAYEK